MTESTAIVITSIFAPTRAVRAYAEFTDAGTIVVGDTKTPADWHLDNVTYLSVDQQNEKYGEFSAKLPFAHYCRKNFGYLEAISAGYDVIVDTDDDNIPLENWQILKSKGGWPQTAEDLGFINTYAYYSSQHIWPRGLPLDCVTSAAARDFPLHRAEATDLAVPVWQGLANGDPDVDAIYRLVDNSPCTFESKPPIVLNKGTISPYNSQNTATFRAAFPLLYLPSYVSFRFTDILRGLIGQVILWDHGYRLGFHEATVFQERNVHDYMADFVDEIPVYLNARKVVDIARTALVSGQPMGKQLEEIYAALIDAEIVGPEELELVQLWNAQLGLAQQQGQGTSG